MHFAKSFLVFAVAAVALSNAAPSQLQAVEDRDQNVINAFNAAKNCFNTYQSRPVSLVNCFVMNSCGVLGDQATICTQITGKIQKLLDLTGGVLLG